MAKSLESVLSNVAQNRRGFLTTLFIGSAVAAVPAIATQVMAAEEEGKKKKKKD